MEGYFDDGAVIFLENADFDANGAFKHNLGGKPMVVMMGGTFCPHCRHASPEFNAFAKECRGMCHAGVLQIPEQKECAKLLSGLYPALGQGVPCYFMIDRNGKFVKTHEGDRSKVALLEFAKSA